MGNQRDPHQNVTAHGYDIPLKELESYPDVFTDIVNALVYEGEQVVDLKHLRQAETETRYRDQKRRLRNQYEDLGRYETDEEGNAKQSFCICWPISRSRTAGCC